MSCSLDATACAGMHCGDLSGKFLFKVLRECACVGNMTERLVLVFRVSAMASVSHVPGNTFAASFVCWQFIDVDISLTSGKPRRNLLRLVMQDTPGFLDEAAHKQIIPSQKQTQSPCTCCQDEVTSGS